MSKQNKPSESHRQRLTREYEETESKIQKLSLDKDKADEVYFKARAKSCDACQRVKEKADELEELECEVAGQANAEVVSKIQKEQVQLNIHLDALRMELSRSLNTLQEVNGQDKCP